MIVYHWTNHENLRSINEHGLLTIKATGNMKAVWFGTWHNVQWALCHIARRHGWDADEMVLLKIEVHRGSCMASSRKGVFYTLGSVPADAIVGCRHLDGSLWTPIARYLDC